MIHTAQFTTAEERYKRERPVDPRTLEKDANGNTLPCCAFCVEDNARYRVQYKGMVVAACGDCRRGHLASTRRTSGYTRRGGKRRPLTEDEKRALRDVIDATLAVFGLKWDDVANRNLRQQCRAKQARSLISYQAVTCTDASIPAVADVLPWSESTLGEEYRQIRDDLELGHDDLAALLDTIRRRAV